MPKIDIAAVIHEKGILTGDAFAALAADPAHQVPAAVTVADIDADGVFWGLAQKHPEDVVAGDVLVPAGCDLAPGAYRLDRQGSTFVSMGEGRRAVIRQPPSTDRALAELLDALAANGMKFTAAVEDWRAAYRLNAGL